VVDLAGQDVVGTSATENLWAAASIGASAQVTWVQEAVVAGRTL
jgi:hypothetical protein